MHNRVYFFQKFTAAPVKWIQFKGRARRNLDELYAGVCDGLTYQEIKEKFPEEFARRQENKLTYRYPRGKEEKLPQLIKACTLLIFNFALSRRIIHGCYAASRTDCSRY